MGISSAEPGTISLWLGIFVEVFALALIPFVILRRKEPPSTAAWILALVFLPGLGATLFLLFGRDRVRFPAQRKLEADRALALSAPRRYLRIEPRAGEAALRTLPSPIDRELFRVGSALAGAEPTTGNTVDLLVDGDSTYEAIGEAIDRAKDHVYAEYYLVQRGRTADWLGERLMAAARRGVSVKLLIDGYGSFWLGRRYAQRLREAGVEVAIFLPARLVLFQPMNLRNHRKIVVVDGEVGFTGGLNIMDEYRRDFLPAPWRDAHLSIRGTAAQKLSKIFEQDWHFATRRMIEHAPTPSEPTIPPMEASGESDATVAIVRSGPDVEGPARETIHRLFFSAITIARSRVYITTPYFIPDRAIVVALQTAALRGVDVRLLLPGRSNHPVVWRAGRSFYEELLEARVSIYEYEPGMIHAKTMVVDGSVALVGSANMDVRSFRLNFEVHAVIRNPETARRLEDCFEADLARARAIDLESFRARSRAERVLEGAARLLSPLM